jgi:HEAT repeat protein
MAGENADLVNSEAAFQEHRVTARAGLQATFAYLSRTENEAAVSLLIPALDSPHGAVRLGALRSLLERRSLAGQREILSRLHLLDERWKAIIAEHRASMSHALRDAILDGSPQLCANGCRAALWFREYDLLPALINALEDEGNPNASLAAETVLALVDLFCSDFAEERQQEKTDHPYRDWTLLRTRLTECLERSVERFSRHKRREVLQAFLMLAGHDNPSLRQILLDPLDSRYLTVIDELTHSRHAEVLRLILDCLEDPNAPSAMLALMAHRSDSQFVKLLLERVGDKPSPFVAHNLGRIGNVAWLHDPHTLINELDDAGQQSLVRLVMASSMNRLESFKTIAHLIVKGQAGARRAAVAALAEFHGAEANQLALKALSDDDEEVQASAIRQLRDRGIPGAISILLDMVSSPSEKIRQAACDSLDEFKFPRFLASFDMLDEDVRGTTGKLVRKIDPSSVPLLREETRSPSRRRRIRALQMASAMQAVSEISDQALQLLDDEDHLVRLEAAKALGQCHTMEVYAALARAADDRSLTVREAALTSLEQISKSSPAIALLSDAAQRAQTEEQPHA